MNVKRPMKETQHRWKYDSSESSEEQSFKYYFGEYECIKLSLAVIDYEQVIIVNIIYNYPTLHLILKVSQI